MALFSDNRGANSPDTLKFGLDFSSVQKTSQSSITYQNTSSTNYSYAPTTTDTRTVILNLSSPNSNINPSTNPSVLPSLSASSTPSQSSSTGQSATQSTDTMSKLILIGALIGGGYFLFKRK